MKAAIFFVTLLATQLCLCWAWSGPSGTTRRAFVASSASSIFLPRIAANAFDGKGSSAYAGRTPLEKASKAKAYRVRITEDVKDFNGLGAALDKGELDGDAWVGFFTQYQRREPDAVGRTYAALADLTGVEKTGGGAALLLATTYSKPNKPPNNLAQYKKYDALLQVFGPIKAAGKAGDAAKAKKNWSKAAVVLSEYLEAVDMPASLSDPLYR